MFSCKFELNDQPMSDLILIDSGHSYAYPAFSGFGAHVNRKVDECLKGVGPIPTGRYYILNRETGGKFGWLRELFNDKSDWLSLYAIDSQIDDQTWCDSVKRGQFRLHPKGTLGISEGCVVINDINNFLRLRSKLLSKPATQPEGVNFKVLGTLQVR